MKTKVKYKSVLVLMLITGLMSCTIKAEKIEYGKDQCSFCSMNIVDKMHAAQYVTEKGKQFKFDAIECMINDITRHNKTGLPIMLVADYNRPGAMIDANSAAFLVSKGIKSPMGGNLSAVSTTKEAERLKDEFSGKIYNLESLTEKYTKQNQNHE